jgi:hypothetical protein
MFSDRTEHAAVPAWYLYGVTRRGSLAALLSADDFEPFAAPLQLLEFSQLAAVVRPVPRSDFSRAALRERLHNASSLEETVRRHHHVIDMIHTRQAILPSKFGTVYASAEDVRLALEPMHDTLLRQLKRMDECDEWAVHMYADRAAVGERVSKRNPAIRLLHDERAAARPGRAYFLAQRLRDELKDATERELAVLAQKAFDRLAVYAVAKQVSSAGPTADLTGEEEILRASFLVSRDRAEEFQEEVCSGTDTSEGLRYERSGPWPPYTFAAQYDGEVG